ncbi:hypothetical protein GC194_10735 [bacterium]|nr:hypothetical protein [bacterium]
MKKILLTIVWSTLGVVLALAQDAIVTEFSEVVYGDKNHNLGDGVYANVQVLSAPKQVGQGYIECWLGSIEVTSYKLNGKEYSGSDLADCGIIFPFNASEGYVMMSISAHCLESYNTCSYFFENSKMGTREVDMRTKSSWDISALLDEQTKKCFNEHKGEFVKWSEAGTPEISEIAITSSPYGTSAELKMKIEECLRKRKEAEEAKKQAKQEKDNKDGDQQQGSDEAAKAQAEAEKKKAEEEEEMSAHEIDLRNYDVYMARGEEAEKNGDYKTAKYYYEQAYQLFPSTDLKARIDAMPLKEAVAGATDFAIGYSRLDPGPGEITGEFDFSLGYSVFTFNRNASIPNFKARGLYGSFAANHTIWFSSGHRVGLFLGANAVFNNPINDGSIRDSSGEKVNALDPTRSFYGKYADMQGLVGINFFGLFNISYLLQYQGIHAKYEPFTTRPQDDNYTLVQYGRHNMSFGGIMLGVTPLRQKRTRLQITGWLVDHRPKGEAYLRFSNKHTANYTLSYGTRIQLGLRLWSFSAFAGSFSYINAPFAAGSPLYYNKNLNTNHSIGLSYYGFTIGFSGVY